MNTRNFTTQLSENDLLVTKTQQQQDVELKVINSSISAKFVVGKRVSLTPQKLRPSNSMLGMRSLKPSKKILGLDKL